MKQVEYSPARAPPTCSLALTSFWTPGQLAQPMQRPSGKIWNAVAFCGRLSLMTKPLRCFSRTRKVYKSIRRPWWRLHRKNYVRGEYLAGRALLTTVVRVRHVTLEAVSAFEAVTSNN